MTHCDRDLTNQNIPFSLPWQRTVEEAKEIIETETPLPARDEDSHDILGTYRIVSDKKEMAICPTNANEFLDIMRRRHAILLQSRISKKPGEFKDKNNSAGNTEFVDKQLVVGTLKKGFEWYSLLQEPFSKSGVHDVPRQ